MPYSAWYSTFWQQPYQTGERITLIRRLMSLLTLGLMASTWHLWVPQEVFPQVPVLFLAGSLPELLQLMFLALAVFGLLATLLDRAEGRYWRTALMLFAGSFVVLCLVDQHRLQPWAYEAVLLAIVMAMADSHRAMTLGRLLTVSIYAYSAVSKLDYNFLHSLGQQFTQAALQVVSLSSANWTENQRVLAAMTFPVGELAIAILLCIPRTRVIGMGGAIVMHVFLLLILGPFGLNQQPAVLIWNVQFIVLAWLLFGGRSQQRKPETDAAEVGSRPQRWTGKVATGVVLLAVGMPALEPFGWWDHWLAWGLYSPGSSRTHVFVRASDVEQLPVAWQPYVATGNDDTVWRQMRLDRWSLETLRVPLYPQARFQLGVAMSVARALPVGSDIRVELYSAANRFTGERDQTTLLTRPQLAVAARRYWVNALPRK